MKKELVLLVSGAGFMAFFLTPQAQTTELDRDSRTGNSAEVAKSTDNIIRDEDAYWEYDNNDRDKIVFGEPMVNPDAEAIDNSTTMVKKAPKRAAAAKGKTDWKQEYPKPLD